MELFVVIIFFLSLFATIGLFSLKYWESKYEYVFLPELRKIADAQALELKRVLLVLKGEFGKLAPTSIRVARVLLHDLALSLAALSRASERQAHKLADLVSHKRGFIQREPKNEFLKQVSEYKTMSTVAELDTKM